MEFKEVHPLLLGLDSHIQAKIGGFGNPPRAAPWNPSRAKIII